MVPVKKIFRKNQIMITALAIMIAVAGYLNFAGEQIGEEDFLSQDGSETALTYEMKDLGYGTVKVNIGKLENLDEKLMQLPYILPSLAGERGTLDLQNYILDKKNITFEKE